jgi:hypothetical protein
MIDIYFNHYIVKSLSFYLFLHYCICINDILKYSCLCTHWNTALYIRYVWGKLAYILKLVITKRWVVKVTLWPIYPHIIGGWVDFNSGMWLWKKIFLPLLRIEPRLSIPSRFIFLYYLYIIHQGKFKSVNYFLSAMQVMQKNIDIPMPASSHGLGPATEFIAHAVTFRTKFWKQVSDTT